MVETGPVLLAGIIEVITVVFAGLVGRTTVVVMFAGAEVVTLTGTGGGILDIIEEARVEGAELVIVVNAEDDGTTIVEVAGTADLTV